MSCKPVIILADDLPTGLKTNFAAVLGMSLGQLRPDLVGDDMLTGDCVLLSEITAVALPILGAAPTELPMLFEAATDLPLRLAYMRVAFEARDYADYTARTAAAPLAGHEPQVILLAGPRKSIDRICCRVPLLR